MTGRLKKYAHDWRSFFIDLIFPIECLGCGRAGQWLCPDCFRSIPAGPDQQCPDCKAGTAFGRFCPDCGRGYALDGVWVAAGYESPLLAEAIKTMKYRLARDIAGQLGALMAACLLNLIKQSRVGPGNIRRGSIWRRWDKVKRAPLALSWPENTWLAPVPLHRRRQNWRGFNQSELLAEKIAGSLNLAMTKGLMRTKNKKPQARLSREQRLINLKDCFRWTGPALRGRNIILVDDVSTTAATLNECAKELKKAGANEVWGLVAARN